MDDPHGGRAAGRMTEMIDSPMRRPARLGARHAAMYQDRSVARSYRNRPPYPDETIRIIADLVPAGCRRVLDVGCGTGFVARPLAALVEAVDALDPSPAMLEVGRRLPGGDRSNLRWILGSAEDAVLRPPYGLVVAGASFHWLRWDVVLPRFAEALVPDGLLAVAQTSERGGPDLRELIARYSTNQDFSVDDDYDWRAELRRRGLLTPLGVRETAWETFQQSFDDFVDGQHSMGGLSRERMGSSAVAEFDRELRAILARTYPAGRVEMEVRGTIGWSRPGTGRPA
jgi:SAM-dependent methyltransferase